MSNIFTSVYENKKLSIRGAFYQFIMTCISHISSASVGREGVCVQLGGIVGNKLFNLTYQNATIIGMSVGFSTLFNTPITGMVFVCSMFKIKSLKYIIALVYCNYVSTFIYKLIIKNNNHKMFFNFKYNELSFSDYLYIVVFIILIFYLSKFFILISKKWNIKLNFYYTLIVLIIMSLFLASQEMYFNNLGTFLIDSSFYKPELISNTDFSLKLIVTVLCLNLGFIGGEVTPLFSIGSCFGVFYARVFDLPNELMVALGYVFIFSSATGSYLSVISLSLELFGYNYILIVIIGYIIIKRLSFNYYIYPIRKEYNVY